MSSRSCQFCTPKIRLEIQLHLRLQVRHTEKYLMVSRCRSEDGSAAVLDHGDIQTCCMLVKSRCACNQGWTWHLPVLCLKLEKLTIPENPNKYSTRKNLIEIDLPCVIFHRKRPCVWLSLHHYISPNDDK